MQYNYIICIILSHIYAFVYTYFENNLNFFVGNGSFFLQRILFIWKF